MTPTDNGGYIEFGDDDVPLGEWSYDEDLEEWIFDPYVPLDAPVIPVVPYATTLPKTGESPNVYELLGLIALLAFIGALTIGLSRSGKRT